MVTDYIQSISLWQHMYSIVTIQEVKQQYEKWSVDRTTLEIFIDDDPSPVIELDQQEEKVEQWKIIPLSSLPRVSSVFSFLVIILLLFYRQISKVAIKNYQIGRRIPHCGFELELLSEQVQRLRHKVAIKGIAFPKDFHIRYPQPEGTHQIM